MGTRTAAAAATQDAYETMVAEAAYYKAEQRGFAPGYEVADWLAAERELLDQILLANEPKPVARKPMRNA